MTFVAIPDLEQALAFKCKLLLNDYLGLAEAQDPDPRVTRGCTARPKEYVQAADFSQVTPKQTPAIAVGLKGTDRDPWYHGTQRWESLLFQVGVRFGSSGRTTFEVGQGPRIYLAALLNMFEQPHARTLSVDGSVRVVGVSDDGIGDAAKSPNGDLFSIAGVTLRVDAPIADREPSFDAPPSTLPGPGDPPREPDVPLTILTLITSVEAMT